MQFRRSPRRAGGAQVPSGVAPCTSQGWADLSTASFDFRALSVASTRLVVLHFAHLLMLWKE